MDGESAARALGPVAPYGESWRRNAVLSWLLETGWRRDSPEDLLAGLGPLLRDMAVPVDRINLAVRLLHPQVFSLAFLWQPGAAVERREGAFSLLEQDAFLLSPFRDLMDNPGTTIRRRLAGPARRLDYPILADLAAEGFTDYLALSLPFGDGRGSAITFATREPDGFQAPALAVIDDAMPVLARIVEIQALRHTSLTLLETYLGRQSGARVLDGKVRRGDGETLQAVIWFSDLRGSTPLAESMDAGCFLETLNGYFDCMAGAVLDHGGEVLRYIGDAALAIFPFAADDTAAADPAPPRAALEAALDARARMADYNDERAGLALPALAHGIGLHVGRVTYGNIGVQRRLEFTVIGTAANIAARIEGLSKRLGETIVVSDAVRRRHPGPWRDLGHHALRGLEAPVPVFAPASR
ncbi:adenylate/guanylate cyclase domain-containing protein [Roseospira goensis]|uniref:Adenylate cyclase n=1 Tax=Roseospira goensis TaxID=391922 RepID=A0A7W6WJC7_9PROT|nr:adenylate/guanylate cyclase domain-containing protein [Roseospira goensis]MBB4284564.1 adenylate cyclase [Roseospira goensis]